MSAPLWYCLCGTTSRTDLPRGGTVYAECCDSSIWQSSDPLLDPMPIDDREPKPCPRCGMVCTYDGWDHVHPNGLGIGSCGE